LVYEHWAPLEVGDERWYFIHPLVRVCFFFFCFLIFLWYWKFGEFFSQTIAKLVEFIVEKKFPKISHPKTSQLFSSRKWSKFPPKKTLSLLAPHFFPTSVAYALGPRVKTFFIFLIFKIDFLKNSVMRAQLIFASKPNFL
jgi:hypothetical protein